MLVGLAAAYALYAKAAKDPLPEKLGACPARCGTASTSTSFTRPRSSALHDFLAAVADWFDRWIVAGVGVVRGTHGTTELAGRALRLVQTGNLQTYAFLFALGVALVLYLVLEIAMSTTRPTSSAGRCCAAIVLLLVPRTFRPCRARRGHAGRPSSRRCWR